MIVDYLEMQRFDEANLEEDPLIIPSCGHPLLMSSMDGHLQMSAVYEMSSDGTVQALRPSTPFSTDETKRPPRCPICRGSLRNINRYGRIVRRAILDESTKRFITSAATAFKPLVESFYRAQGNLRASHSRPRSLDVPLDVAFGDTRDMQFQLISKITAGCDKNSDMKICRQDIATYFAKVHKDATPFGRIWNLIEVARRRAGRAGPVELRSPVSLISFHVMALGLLIRCDVALLADILHDLKKLRKGLRGMRLRVDLSKNREDSECLIDAAQDAKDFERTVEGHIFYARYVAMEIPFISDRSTVQALKKVAETHINAAHELCQAKGGKLDSLVAEVQDAERSLAAGTFVQTVTSDERRSILTAMAQEYCGIGHWYTCTNGHPFVVGECGRPMELARCSQCDAPIGGQNHRPTDGVARADDLENELREMNLQ